jgi:cell division protein FtsB
MTAFDILKAFLKGIDLKTILIILLVVMVGAFLLFNRNGPGSNVIELDLLKKQHKKEMREVNDANNELEVTIADYMGIIEANLELIATKDARISSLKSETEASKRRIANLKKELAAIDEQFENMGEQELLDWVRSFLKSRGIKE